MSHESTTPVRLTVHDVQGRRVRGLLAEGLDPGRYSVYWNGRDEGGRAVASGVYFVRMEAGAVSQTRKLVKIR